MAKQSVPQPTTNGKATRKPTNGASPRGQSDSLAADIKQGVAELQAFLDSPAGITRGELAQLLGCGEDPSGSARDMALASLTEAGFVLDQALKALEDADIESPVTRLVYRASHRLQAALNILCRMSE